MFIFCYFGSPSRSRVVFIVCIVATIMLVRSKYSIIVNLVIVSSDKRAALQNCIDRKLFSWKTDECTQNIGVGLLNENKQGSCDEHININILCSFFDLLKPVLLSQAGVKPITNIDDIDDDVDDDDDDDSR